MQLLGIAEDEDYGDFTDINDGRDFTVEAVTGDIGGRQGIKCSIRVKPKTSPLGTDKTQLKSWLSEQPNVLELQKKMTFEDLKSVLEKFLNPEAETEEEEVVAPAKVAKAAPKDLPWEDDEDEEDEAPAPKANYALKASSTKTSKAAKFDALFEDEE